MAIRSRDINWSINAVAISPSISAAAYLRLNISLQVSTFAGAVTGSIPPPRITREIQTSVNVPDGYTMVIGGIISDNETKTREGLPWLANIPILGALFRRDTTNNTQTKLYFFVTPHILRDKDFADLIDYSYKRKLDAAEVMGRERMRIIDPEFGREADGEEFERFEIPLYEAPQRGEVTAEEVGLDAETRNEMLEDGTVYTGGLVLDDVTDQDAFTDGNSDQ